MSEAHRLVTTAEIVPWSGSTFSYRGARIECSRGNHVCGLHMAGHPLGRGSTFGEPGTITPLVDAWIDTGELPAHRRPCKAG